MTLLTSGVMSTRHGIHIITKLLRNGADPNTMGPDGSLPIHNAIQLYDPSRMHILHVLLNHGADPNRRNVAGRTPLGSVLHMAMKAPHQKARWNLPLDMQVISLLLRSGADPDIAAECGQTALSLAITSMAQIGWHPIGTVVRLLRYGANPNRAGGQPDTLIGQTLITTISLLGYEAAKADFNKLSKLFTRRVLLVGSGKLVDHDGRIAMRMVPRMTWKNPIIPILLRAGAGVSWGDLELPRASLIAIGGYFDGTHGAGPIGDIFIFKG